MRPTRSTAATALAASAALVAAGFALAPAATADDLAPQSTFTMPVDETNGKVTLPASGEGIPNVDSVKSTIRAYYNATGGLADRTSSPYISEVAGIETQMLGDFPALTGDDIGTKAIVLDTDDTLLWNYDYEDKGSNFNYNPTTNEQWVTGSACNAADGTDFGAVKTGAYCFPAVPGMPETVQTLHERGYALYVITGRPASQQTATIGNLTAAGFTDGSGDPLFDADNVFTKDVANQPWVDMSADGVAGSASTVEYKALTRKHIEDTDDVEIVGNVGDQLSDLWGGYANEAVKIPNPTYFLSSPDLTAEYAGEDDQADELTLPDTYTMAPDGSSGLTEPGDGIPNIDPVRAEIRAYYNATNGIADKTSSPYITELAGLEKAWTEEIVTSCEKSLAGIATAQQQIAATKAAQTQAATAVARAVAKLHRATTALKKAKRKHQPAKVRKAKKAKRQATAALHAARAAKAAAAAKLATLKVPGKPAVVFDADDTTLWTYDMEDGAMKFVFNTTVQNDEWVQPQKFPATPGMPELVADVADAGCTIIGLTGRGTNQKYATLGNLAKVGYSDFRANRYYTKPSTMPSYVDCDSDGKPACSTIEYKSGTRKMLEETKGFDIVANLGDQFSDLIGGYADKTYKLPNPTYYLP